MRELICRIIGHNWVWGKKTSIKHGDSYQVDLCYRCGGWRHAPLATNSDSKEGSR